MWSIATLLLHTTELAVIIVWVRNAVTGMLSELSKVAERSVTEQTITYGRVSWAFLWHNKNHLSWGHNVHMIVDKAYDGEIWLKIRLLMFRILKLNFETSLVLGLRKKILCKSTSPKMLPTGHLKSGAPRSVAVCEHLLLQLWFDLYKRVIQKMSGVLFCSTDL